jgi:hypothetical protein
MDDMPQLVVQRLEDRAVIRCDLVFAIDRLLAGHAEDRLPRDRWDRHAIEGHFLYLDDLFHDPPVDRYVGLLRRLLPAREWLPKWPGGERFALALSHDVDYPEMIRWIECLRYVAKYRHKARPSMLGRILSGKEHFWRFRDWMEMEAGIDARSAFYFCGFKGSLPRYFLTAPDPFYDVRHENFKQIARELDEGGWEIGLHGSYFAYRSREAFAAEKQLVEKAFGVEILGQRHHYWHLNADEPLSTSRIHEQIGLLYDSSLSFENHSGFRRGICSPFSLYDDERQGALALLQVPPTLMDDHLFGHAHLHRFDNYEAHIDSLLSAVSQCEGVFTADFHARVNNATFFPGWGDAYRYLLARVQEMGPVYKATPLAIARHWLKRRERLTAASIDETRFAHQSR